MAALSRVTYSRWLARAVARPLALAHAGRRLRVDPVQLQARLHKHLQLQAHAPATAHRDRQVARPGTKIDDQQIAGTQNEVLHFNVSSANNKTAGPQTLGVTVDFIDSDTGMAGLYNHKRLRTPKSLEFAATAASPSGAR